MSGYDPATLALIQERIRRMVDEGQTDNEIREELLFDWHNSEEWRQISTYLHQYRKVAPPAATGGGRGTVPMTHSQRVGYLSQEQAEALYQRHGSYRKAAKAEGYSTTHLRRKRLGLD